RDVHSVFDQVAAGTLDDTGGDGQTGGEVLFVVKVVPVFQQIVGAIVDCGAVTAFIALSVALRRMPAATSLEFPRRISNRRSLTQRWVAGVPSPCRAKLASHRYSSTWITSRMMVGCTPW